MWEILSHILSKPIIRNINIRRQIFFTFLHYSFFHSVVLMIIDQSAVDLSEVVIRRILGNLSRLKIIWAEPRYEQI